MQPVRAGASTRPQRSAEAPVKLDVEVNLDFDRLVLAGSGDGSVELRPDGGSNVSGSITSIGARAMVGEVVIRGEPGRYVRIDLPRRIELQGLLRRRIRLESLRSDLPQMPQPGRQRPAQIPRRGVLALDRRRQRRIPRRCHDRRRLSLARSRRSRPFRLNS